MSEAIPHKTIMTLMRQAALIKRLHVERLDNSNQLLHPTITHHTCRYQTRSSIFGGLYNLD